MMETPFEKIAYFKGAIKSPDVWMKEVDSVDDNIISAWQPWESNPIDGSKPWIYGDRKFVSISGIERTENNAKSFDLAKVVLDAMETCAIEYAKFYNLDISPEIGPMFVLNKYEEHEVMGQHIDWNEDQRHVEYSFVVYLNDDYEGGELFFSKQNVSIKPEAGSIAIFPSKEPYFHGSNKLIKGRKVFVPHSWRSGIIEH